MVTSPELDRALAQLKRLGKCHYESDFTKGYELGIGHAIAIIERLGGMSPEARAEHERDRNMPPRYEREANGPWPRPSYHKQAKGTPVTSPVMRGEDVLEPDYDGWSKAFNTPNEKP